MNWLSKISFPRKKHLSEYYGYFDLNSLSLPLIAIGHVLGIIGLLVLCLLLNLRSWLIAIRSRIIIIWCISLQGSLPIASARFIPIFAMIFIVMLVMSMFNIDNLLLERFILWNKITQGNTKETRCIYNRTKTHIHMYVIYMYRIWLVLDSDTDTEEKVPHKYVLP